MARMSGDFVNQLESGGYRVLEVLEQPLDGRSSSSSSICSSGAPMVDFSPCVDNASKSTASSTPLGHLGRSPLTPPPASAATPSSSSSMLKLNTAEKGKTTLRRLPLITQRLPPLAPLVVSAGSTAMSGTLHRVEQVDIDERGKAILHVWQPTRTRSSTKTRQQFCVCANSTRGRSRHQNQTVQQPWFW